MVSRVLIGVVSAGVIATLGPSCAQPPESAPAPASGPPAAATAVAPTSRPSTPATSSSNPLRDLKVLELEQPRTRELAADLYRGHTELAREEVLSLIGSLDHGSASDPRMMSRLHALVRDETLLPESLVALSRLAHPVVADLLHELCVTEPGSRAALLACDLAEQPDLVSVRTPELRALLALERVTDCEVALDLVRRHQQTLDARALAVFARFERLTGCGKQGEGDCFSCMRTLEIQALLGKAKQEARGRPFSPPYRPGPPPAPASEQQRKPVE